MGGIGYGVGLGGMGLQMGGLTGMDEPELG